MRRWRLGWSGYRSRGLCRRHCQRRDPSKRADERTAQHTFHLCGGSPVYGSHLALEFNDLVLVEIGGSSRVLSVRTVDLSVPGNRARERLASMRILAPNTSAGRTEPLRRLRRSGADRRAEQGGQGCRSGWPRSMHIGGGVRTDWGNHTIPTGRWRARQSAVCPA